MCTVLTKLVLLLVQLFYKQKGCSQLRELGPGRLFCCRGALDCPGYLTRIVHNFSETCFEYFFPNVVLDFTSNEVKKKITGRAEEFDRGDQLGNCQTWTVCVMSSEGKACSA